MKILKNNITYTLLTKTILLLIISIWFIQPIYAQLLPTPSPTSNSFANQEVAGCGINHAISKSLEQHPELEAVNREALKVLVKEVDSILTSRMENRLPPQQVMIPVVFHYFYDECAPAGSYELGTPPVYENVRFENAIETLNKDFNGITSTDWYSKKDSYYIDHDATNNPNELYPQRESLISFRLAEKDPYGNPTSGINRIRNNLTYAGVADGKATREIIQWPRNTYLNIYVVEKVDAVNSSGVARYPEQTDNDEKSDGASIARWALDPTYNDGNKKESDGYYKRDGYRYILSHEVGHWLGLRHLWGAKADHNGKAISGFCEIDDFDFYTDLMNDFNTGNEETDLPNQNFNDTPCADDQHANWNTEPYNIFPCSGNDCPDGSIDYNFNIMDYSSWGILFTEGQKDFMETTMVTSLSQRNEIKGNNLNAFPNLAVNPNNEFVTYSNYNDTIAISSVVFSHGSIFFESGLDNGSIDNNVAEIELRGGLRFSNPACSCPFNYPFTLTNDKYSFATPPVEITNITEYDFGTLLPSGLTEEVIITSATTAQLVISGAVSPNLNDYITQFSISNSVLSGSDIDKDLRSKIIKFDFADLIGTMYDNRKYSNVLVGPNASNWTAIFVDFLGTYIYLYYENGEFIIKDAGSVLKDDELVSNQDIKAKILLKGDDIIGDFEVGDVKIDVSDFQSDENFYIGIGTSVCNGDEPLKGWLKLKYDESCNAILISAFGINDKAGKITEPTLLYTPSVINQMEDGSFEGLEIELVKSDPNQKFKSTINSTNILNYVEIGDIVKFVNKNDPLVNGFNKNDLKFEKISDTKFSVTANSNSAFWSDVSKSFAFELMVNQSAFDLVGANLNQAQQYVTVLIEPQKTTEYTEVSKGTSYINSYNDVSLPLKFKDIQAVYDRDKPTIGFNSYNDGVDKGYIFYSNTKYSIDGLCKPGSNELELLSYNASLNLNNFKELSTGSTTSEGGIESNSIYIPSETIINFLNSEKYACFKLSYNCNEYYGWVKFSINDDGSLSDFVIVSSNVSNNILSIGQLPEFCFLTVDRGSLFSKIQNFSVDGVVIPESELESDIYSNFTNLTIPIDLNLENDNQYKLTAENITIYNKYWYAWIDYNRNNYYEENELLFNDYENADEDLDIDVEFPYHLSGSYTFRIMASYRTLNSPLVGCRDLYSGEVEDYTIQFINYCPPNLTITNNLQQGDHKVSNKIQINANSRLSQSRAANLESACIVLEPLIKDDNGNTLGNGSILIEYGSTFCAEAIEACNTPILKQADPVLNQTTFKVFPNPFSQQCNIEYSLNTDAAVTLFVSDITGKVVATLTNGEQQNEGSHKAAFNAKGLSQGIYYCTLIAGEKVETQKMVITK